MVDVIHVSSVVRRGDAPSSGAEAPTPSSLPAQLIVLALVVSGRLSPTFRAPARLVMGGEPPSIGAESSGRVATAGPPRGDARQTSRPCSAWDQRATPTDRQGIGYRLFNLLLHLSRAPCFVQSCGGESRTDDSGGWRADPLVGSVCALAAAVGEVVNYMFGLRSASLSSRCVAVCASGGRARSRRLRWCAGDGGLRARDDEREIVTSAPLAVMSGRAFGLPSWRALLRPGNGRDGSCRAVGGVPRGVRRSGCRLSRRHAGVALSVVRVLPIARRRALPSAGGVAVPASPAGTAIAAGFPARCSPLGVPRSRRGLGAARGWLAFPRGWVLLPARAVVEAWCPSPLVAAGKRVV